MTQKQIEQKLTRLPGWKYNGHRKTIRTELRCKDFMAAVRLIGKIASIAQRMGHHPDLHLTRYRRLRIVLSTHSEGKVTLKDINLALKISRIRRRIPAQNGLFVL